MPKNFKTYFKKTFLNRLAFILFIGLLVGGCSANKGEQKMLALLNGDQAQEIISFETQYQQRCMKCTDKEVLNYLKEALLKHSSKGDYLGASYKGYFKFKDGVVFETDMTIGKKGFSISI